MKVSRPISPILNLKLVAMATSRELADKEGQISHLRSNIYYTNEVEYHNFDFKRFICDDLSTWYKNLVNFGGITPELGCAPHPRSAVWLRSLVGATARPCGDQYYSVLLKSFARGRHCYAARATRYNRPLISIVIKCKTPTSER